MLSVLTGWEWLRPFAKGSAKGSDNKVKPTPNSFPMFSQVALFSPFLWKQEDSDYAMVGQGWRDWLRLHYTLLPWRLFRASSSLEHNWSMNDLKRDCGNALWFNWWPVYPIQRRFSSDDWKIWRIRLPIQPTPITRLKRFRFGGNPRSCRWVFGKQPHPPWKSVCERVGGTSVRRKGTKISRNLWRSHETGWFGITVSTVKASSVLIGHWWKWFQDPVGRAERRWSNFEWGSEGDLLPTLCKCFSNTRWDIQDYRKKVGNLDSRC